MSIQRLILKYIIVSYRSTATSSLQVLSGIVPIDIDIFYDLQKQKLLQLKEDICVNDMIIYSSDYEEKINHFKQDFRADHSFKCIIEHNDFQIYDTAIYTDGSRMNSGTAFAYVVFQKGKLIYSSSHSLLHINTIYQAELMAIDYAVGWCIENNVKNVNIFTDSQSFITAIKNVYSKNEIIYNLNNKIISNKINVSFGWIRGHEGNIGNELANTYAQIEASKEIKDKIVKCNLPRSNVNRIMLKMKIQEWQDRWNSDNTGRHTFDYFPTVNLDFLCNSPVITYFVTGHGAFPSYLERMKKMPNSYCHCGSYGSPEHYLFENCTIVKNSFKKNDNEPLSDWIHRSINRKFFIKKMNRIYNKLNDLYTDFINYKF